MPTRTGLRVMIISPLSGDVEANVAYARRCVSDSLSRGEEPFAAHLHYPQCLDDTNPEERARGMQAGLAWMAAADHVAVYIDRGFSDGMLDDIEAASKTRRNIDFRKLPGYGEGISVDG